MRSSRIESSGVSTNGHSRGEAVYGERRSVPRRHTWLSVAAGILAAILVAAGGVALLFGTARKWAGQTTVVVLPGKKIAIGPSASYWDTLSRGQITSTVAQVLALPRFKQLAGEQLSLSPARLAAVTVSAQEDTGTALVTVTAQGPNGSDAANMSDAVVAQAEPTVNALIAPYSVTVVSNTGGHASPMSTTSTSKYLVILGVVAVALGFGVQQAVSQLSAAASRRSRHANGPAPEPALRGRGDHSSAVPEPGGMTFPDTVHVPAAQPIAVLRTESHDVSFLLNDGMR